MKNYLPLGLEIEIVNKRKMGHSPCSLMLEYGIKKHHFYNIINRDGRDKIKPNKIFTQDNNFFDSIDSEVKAYWLGFIFADGFVRRSQLSIGLASKDKSHLERFAKDIKSDSPITDKVIKRKYKGEDKIYYSSTFNVYSRKVVKDLERYGLYTCKSLTLKPPLNLPDQYIRHFIRGYFDGDGCITNYKVRNKLHKKIKILGTYSFLSWINSEMSLNNISFRNIDKQTNKIFRIQYNTKDVESMCRYLYLESSVFLQRKKIKFI